MIPVSQTLPDVNLDEILASLDADTRDYLRAAAQRRRAGPRLRGARGAQLAQAIRRLEPTAKYAREINEGLAAAAPQPRARRAQLLAADRRARPARHAARELRAELQRGLRDAGRRRTRRCGRSCRSCPGTLQTTQATLGKVDDARRRARADARGAAARRRARSGRRCSRRGRSCASRRRSSATRSARSRAPRCRRSRSCGPAMRDLAAATPDLTRVVQGRQPAAEHGRLQPAGRQGGGLPLLAVVGQPRRQRDLLHRRTRTARSGAAWSCCRARRAQLLDAVAPGQPAARHARRAAQRAVGPEQICPRRRRRSGAEAPVVKDAPSFGKIAAMVLFALSCFGLLLFLWLAFGGPVPLKPKGYRFHTSFAEAGQLALEADVRISGVPVGKVKTITPDKVNGPRGRRDPAALALRAAAVGRAGDPAPEDAAGRDLRRAHAGPQLAPSRSPRAASCRPRRCPTRSSSTRSCARSTPRRAPRSRTGCRRRRRRSPATGATSTTRSATSAPFAEDTADLVAILNRQEGARLAPDRQHRDRLRRADRARRAAALADREHQHGVLDDRRARRRAAGRVPRAADVREASRELTFERLDEFAARDRPADHAAAAGGARALADARGPRGHLARPAQPAASSCSR